jgi:hypothetical protein
LKHPDFHIDRDRIGLTGYSQGGLHTNLGQVWSHAARLNPYGIRNAVEVQEWTLNPANTNDWAGAENLAEMIPPGHIDIASWSIFQFNLNDTAAAMVARIVAFMDEYLPGIPWDAASCGWSVPIGATAQQRQTRANQVTNLITEVLANDSKGFSWYDVLNTNLNRDFTVTETGVPGNMPTGSMPVGLLG